ncbi:hypothetical protein WR25_05458 [Diploscapter pachys]|uniref:Lipase domain-containing protein n=1 Tax=Diploscapter pachys TaxID=2018661 RepID=A0A2A2KM93_9BILA|nr:hypothetical protein WR25_05458 [Diploscapter pachys]
MFLLNYSLFTILLVSYSFAAITGPLTQDFQDWLKSNGYDKDDFVRTDEHSTQGSYGGKTASANTISNTPVIFIHGNSDSALKSSASATGWDNTIDYFLTKGYTEAELYATSWGDTSPFNAGTRTHNCALLTRMRRFLEAVLAYTKANKVSLITHSMGVTIGRKIIKGGNHEASDGSCNLGSPLNSKIEVYLGLSGGNFGLCNCEGGSEIASATCNNKDGLWPGDSCGLNILTCGAQPLPWPCSNVQYSKFLMKMNADKTKEADYVFSGWSHMDDLIMYNDIVWGRPTSQIPTEDGHKIYDIYTHMETKELTANDQYTFVHDKKIPN